MNEIKNTGVEYTRGLQSTSNYVKTYQPKVSLESVDTVSFSTITSPQKRTFKDVVVSLINNITAARPSGLTYLLYGKPKFIDKIETSHHKTRDKYHYMEFPEGTNVMTNSGAKAIKENQVAIVNFDGKFDIMNIQDILNDTAEIITDTGSIKTFAQKQAQAKRDTQAAEHKKIDNELEAAGVKYLGRLNKNGNDLSQDKVFVEINGEPKEYSTILYTKDDYMYKTQILELLKKGELKDDTILFI